MKPSTAIMLAVPVVLLSIGTAVWLAATGLQTKDVAEDPFALARASTTALSVHGIKLGDNVSKIPAGDRVHDATLDQLNKANGTKVVITKDAIFSAESDGIIHTIAFNPPVYNALHLEKDGDVERIFGKPDSATTRPSNPSTQFSYQGGRLVVWWSADPRKMRCVLITNSPR